MTRIQTYHQKEAELRALKRVGTTKRPAKYTTEETAEIDRLTLWTDTEKLSLNRIKREIQSQATEIGLTLDTVGELQDF